MNITTIRRALWRRLAVKSFVYSVLIAAVGGVYVVGVVRIDASFGLSSDWLAPPQVAAASLAALVFQPARTILERLADRVVYGRRLAPHEVIARVSALTQVGSGGSEALRSLAELTARTLGTTSAAVQLTIPAEGELTYRWPGRGQAPSHEQRIPVTHQGIVVGALLVPAAPRGGLPRQRRAQLADLVRVAGVVMHNTAMSIDLDRRVRAEQARSAEIRASRWRIVTAQDSERRDLERDLHDVAQPGMTSVRLALGLVNHLASGTNEDAYGSALESLHGHIEMAAAGLRQTLHGIDPPALITAGIVPALRATAESLRLEVDFRVGAGVRDKRFDRLVEATVFTCCSEALHNSAKHSPDAQVILSLDLDDDGQLRFEVGDDGAGFDPETVRSGGGLQNMADRIAAVGGSLAIESRPTAGTRVRGTVPTSSQLAGSVHSTVK